MSDGIPSMTALLGMLALAGYQNRDKISELLKAFTPGTPSAKSPGGLLANLGSSTSAVDVGSLLNGGIRELLARFKQSGHGDVAQSWVDQGPNKAIVPADLKSAIGPDVLERLGQQTGLSQQILLDRLSHELPNAVDKYTPRGQVPA